MVNNWYTRYTSDKQPAATPVGRIRPALLKALVFGILCILFPLLSQAQANRAISGKVTDGQSVGLPGVTILVPGTAVGTSTGADGTFQLQVPESATTLSFSFVGYAAQQVDITGKTTVQVSMKDDAQALNEIVVVGYGTARKQDLTGAVSVVTEKEFNKGTYTSPDQLIQGRVSGVQITNSSGQPGGAANIKIRGSSAVTGTGQPLYVVDGVPLDGRTARPGQNIGALGDSPDSNPLNFLNPTDIESMTVLKDASATAIYGSRAAYGVVLITTKRGQSGDARVDIGASTGTSSIMRRLEVLNASQFKQAITYYGAPNTDKGGDTDALGAILQRGTLQNYNAALSGGTENGRYRLSVGYLNQEGIVRKTGFEKFSTSLSTNLKFLESKKLGTDINITASQFREQLAPITNNAGFKGSLISQALQWNPTEALRRPDGSLNITKGGSLINPLAQQELYDDNARVTTVLASISPYYKFTDWLDYRLLYSVNYSTGIRRTSLGQDLNFDETQGLGFASIGNNELQTQQVVNTLNFNRKIATDLNLGALLGYEYTTFANSGSNVNARGPADGFGNYGLDYTNYIQFSNPSSRNISSFVDPFTALQSFFGRAILNYKDRYLVTATLRSDESSKFGPNNKIGYFPSFSAAWDVSQEDFFKMEAVNQLKLRAGYGRTGNQEFPAGSAQGRYNFTNNGALGQVNNPNENLKWQSDAQYNVGIDFALFNNKVTATVDYFNKKTTDLLFPSAPIQPAPPGGVVRWVNLAGEIVNKGVEASVTTSLIDNERVGLGFNVNATFIRNSVSGVPGTIFTGALNGQGLSGVFVQVIQDGLPINAFYTRDFRGLDANGQGIYGGDGALSFVGNPNPKTLLGFSTNARFMKLSLVANFTGVFGQDIYNNTLNSVGNVGQIGAGKNIALVTFENPSKESLTNAVTASSRYVEKGDYLKLSNVTLSYGIGSIGKAFKGANVYASGQNLFVLTKYTGFDPEISTNKAAGGNAGTNGSSPSNGIPSIGIDYVGYPSARVFTFGVNFSL